MRLRYSSLKYPLAVAVTALLLNFALAQFPTAQLHSIYPFGAKIGTSVDASVTGINIDSATDLRFSDPRIIASRKPDGVFSISIPAGVKPGMYDVRTYDSENGLSNPRLFVVEDLKEVRSNEKNNSRESAQSIELESIVNGRCKVELSNFYKIDLPQGKRVLIECIAHRADTKFDGVFVLTDSLGKILARSNDVLRRDPLIDFTVEKSGEYFLEVSDFLHQGGNDYGYRLKFSTAPRIDYVFPPSGLPGAKSKFKLYGRNLQGGKFTDIQSLDGKQLEELEVEIELADIKHPHDVQESMLELREMDQDHMMYHIELPNGRSNSVPIYFAEGPVTTEVESHDSSGLVQHLRVPSEVAGQFNPKGDQDRYSFNAMKDEELWIEVTSARMGHSTDPAIILQQIVKDKTGKEKLIDITELDDSKYFTPEERQSSSADLANNDIAYKFVAPRTGTYQLTVRDVNYLSRGSSQYVYRLAIRKPRPNFQLIAFADQPTNPLNNNLISLWTPHLLKGGSLAIRLYAMRQDNFDRDIVVSAQGLPEGVTCKPITIGAGMKTGALIFRASTDAPNWGGPIRMVGKATVAENEVVREAESGVLIWGSPNRTDIPSRSRLSAGFYLSVSGIDQPPATLDIDTAPIETCLNGKFEIPIKITRRNGFKEPIRFFDNVLPRTISFGFDDADQRNSGKTEVVAKMNIRGNAQPGTYTVVMQGVSRVNGYRRKPAEADAAATKKDSIEKQLRDINDKLKVAERDKANQENKLTQSRTAFKKIKIEYDAVNEPSEQLGKKLADAELNQKQAELRRNESLAKIDSLKREKATIERSLNAATEQFRRTSQYSQPKSFNYTCYSEPVKVIVHPAPFEIKLESNELTLRAGEKAKVPITVKRLFELENAINIQLFSKDAKEIQAKEVLVENNDTSGSLEVEATQKAKSGIYPMLVRARTLYNGQVSLVELKLNVTVLEHARTSASERDK